MWVWVCTTAKEVRVCVEFVECVECRVRETTNSSELETVEADGHTDERRPVRFG